MGKEDPVPVGDNVEIFESDQLPDVRVAIHKAPVLSSANGPSMQNVAAQLTTEASAPAVPVGSVGSDAGDQLVPLNSSANGVVPDSPRVQPTATQSCSEAHETESRLTPSGRPGVDSTSQEDPLNKRTWFVAVVLPLTRTQNVAFRQERGWSPRYDPKRSPKA
jgi:hypothetical protein